MKRVKIALDDLLKEKGISRYELARRMDIHYQTLDRYYKNTVVRYDSDILRRICEAMNCDICDIIKLVDE